ncbi:MAG: type IV pilin protein [Burkholderiaceae bacterium]
MMTIGRNLRPCRPWQSGFTLVEIMIALAVLAILTAIAVPNYSEYVMRTARADARATMMEVNQFMQRFYAMNNAYDRNLAGAAVVLPTELQQSPRTGTPRYLISLVALTPDSYRIRAIPVGPSGSDACGRLVLTSTGRRTSQGLTADECWR